MQQFHITTSSFQIVELSFRCLLTLILLNMILSRKMDCTVGQRNYPYSSLASSISETPLSFIANDASAFQLTIMILTGEFYTLHFSSLYTGSLRFWFDWNSCNRFRQSKEEHWNVQRLLQNTDTGKIFSSSWWTVMVKYILLSA